MTDASNKYSGNEIAIVGMSCRFPGAIDEDSYWANLAGGTESIRFFTASELREHGLSESLLRDPSYVRANGVLDGIDLFDAHFFGFSARDASIMDPQHRLFLECAWESLENAGYDPARYEGSIGVFGGSGMTAYMMYNLISNPDLMDSVGEFLIRHTGNDKDFLCTRVSYNFNLRGPSINVQTACSTSLVAVHLASQHLLSGECDMALAGGVTLQIDQMKGYRYEQGEILSKDGHCRPFDADSSGTVFGSGAGIVVLKRLEDALRDRDTIRAIVRGSAVNNDGSLKVSYLAPSVDGQAGAIAEAVAISDVDPATVTYIETHGTGTPVGDPIELAALRQAYDVGAAHRSPCAIGSVKSNIGHLDTAAGIASLIKATLALENRLIPPTLHYRNPNPQLGIDQTRFYVNATAENWEPACGVLRAGVSSLGVGGTNAHVVLEEAPSVAPAPAARGLFVLPFSAKTESALQSTAARLSETLLGESSTLADTAFTLAVGRGEWRHRAAVVASSSIEAARHLRTRQRWIGPADTPGSASPIFLFSGGGAQYAGMGAGLYRRDPTYTAAIDRCVDHLDSRHGIHLRSLLAEEGSPGDIDDKFQRPSIALPSLLATQYALAEWWMSRGVQPVAMAGHSMGEYTAACLAGVFTLEEALDLVVLRGRLFESLPPGAMLSVSLSEDKLRPLLSPEVSVAAINAPELTLASGPVAAIERLQLKLGETGVDVARIRIAVAAHSTMVEPILDEFREFLQKVPLRNPAIPFVSDVSGTWITATEAVDPEYWVRHLRQPVRFADSVGTLLSRPNPVFIEVGPGRTLTSLARLHPRASSTGAFVTTMRHPKEEVDDYESLKGALAAVWTAGVSIDWAAEFRDLTVGRVPLPTYPFERQSYWIEPGRGRDWSAPKEAARSRDAIQKLPNLESWVNAAEWARVHDRAPRVVDNIRSFVVVGDRGGVAENVCDSLRLEGHNVQQVDLGPTTGESASQTTGVLQKVLRDMIGSTHDVTDILFLSPLDTRELELIGTNAETALNLTFFPVLEAVQVLADMDVARTRLYAFSAGGFAVQPDDRAAAWPATLAGPVRVLPKELPGLTAVHIDLDGAASTQDISSGVLSEVLREPDSRGLIAVRGGMSYVRSVKPVDVQPGPTLFRRRGTYIITGGLGGVALSLARELALRFSASFVLMSRSPFPPPTEWSRILGEQPDSEVARRIRGIRAIEELGSRVSIETLDVTDPTSTEEVLKRIVAQRGSVSGVFHAAGVLDDGPGLTKERAHARRVLEPKVEGSLNVVHAAQQSGCPFVVLFGSTSAHLAPAGQVDYVAANSFLDSTAHALDSPTCRVFAVDWGIWRNLGMTATHADAPDAKPEQHLEHHLFYGVSSTEDSRAYHIRFDTTTDWYINEHRLVDGRALMPGTLVLEMVRAAFELETGLNRARISGLVFQLPIFVRDDESVEARLTLTPEEDGYHFAVVSVTNEGTVEHASGSIAPEAEHVPVVPPQISSPKLPANEIPFGSGSNQRKYLDFGPRWNCLHELTFGSREAEAELLLPKTYAAEAQYFGLHPALMDVATGCALGLSEAYLQEPGLCVPISYGHVRILGAVPAHCRSYVQLHGDGSARSGILSFDAVVSDMSGRPLVVIEDFLMKLVDEADLGVVERPYDRDHATGITNLTELGARFGIEAQEGASILELLLTESGHPHRIVSSLPWATIVSVLQMQEAPAVLRRETDVAPAVPRDEVEQALAGLWQSLLGAGEVGIYDDFFDLGGHSLIAVRLFSKIRSMYGVDMSLATLFEAPTVAAVAVLVRAQLGLPGVEAGGDGMATTSVPSPLPAESGRVATAWSPLVEIRATGTHAPFFCVHGAGGNVLNFRDLAHLLPTTRPFYGLQARGVDGRHRQHTRIEDMAAEYVAAIRKVQPSGPYLVGGYSGGGVVALEMAQQLRANGEETSLVVLFDTFHPHLPPRPGLSRADKLKSHVRNTFSGGAGYIGETLANRGKHVAFQWRNMRLRLRQKLGLKLPLGLREIVTVDGFLHAAARYAVRPYDGDVALFAATDRSHIYSHVSLGLEWERDLPRLRILKIPGNHDNLVRKPNVGKLADLLERELKRASPSPARHNPATQSMPAPTAGSSRVGADWSPLVEIRSSGSNTPFFCVHGAGGNVLNFRDLAHLIPTERPFYGLQSRGTAKLLQEHTRIEEMAAEYLEVIRKVQPVGPYLLGGYSGGGIIALEMAQQLRAANENAARVVFIDTFHPRLPPRPRYAKHSTDLRSVREFMVYYLGETLVNRAKRLRFRWHTGQLVLRNRLGLPLPLTLRQKVTVDTFLQAAERYAVRPYDGDVTLFVATDRSGIYSHLSPGLEWERDLPHLRIIKVPGNHGNLVKRPNVGTLADLLERELTRAPTTPTRPERATPSRSTVSRP